MAAEVHCYRSCVWIRVIILTVVCQINANAIKVLATQSRAEWSEWSEWGECSRPCGGGLANMTRTCLGASDTCKGRDILFRVCNHQGCSGSGDTIRDLQCRSYDGVAIKDNYYRWVPHYKPGEPCALYCLTIETGFILKMAPNVWNGTSCGTFGSGVCIDGRCRRVGCDGIVGSRQKLDSCGACGGNGESCDQSPDKNQPMSDKGGNLYHWDVRWTKCSCGTRVQRPTVLCVSSESGYGVDDMYCLPKSKPSPEPSRQCPDDSKCDYRWHAFKWGSCSRTCGEGLKHRRVLCLKLDAEGKGKRAGDRKCDEVKPDITAPCNHGDCPEWLTGPWSPCSGSCGIGTQKRKVVCKSVSPDGCHSLNKPAIVQQCMTGRACGGDNRPQQDDSSASKHDFYDDARLLGLMEPGTFQYSEWGPCSSTCGEGYRHRDVSCIRGETEVPLSQCAGTEPVSKEMCMLEACPLSDTGDREFIWRYGRYGPCSRPCGGGEQYATLECQESRTGRQVLDSKCDGVDRPAPLQRLCNAITCPPSWNVSEYGECSAPCGGGSQSRTVECIQVTASGSAEKLPVFRCSDPIPMSERSCNLMFCQAEWHTGSWGECSVTCGLGIETRSVFCVKYLKDGVRVNVSDTECIAPRPALTRQCHFGDCYRLEHLPAIKEKKGTYIQLKRFKRVKLVVGETAVLLPNQPVKVRCPVKNFRKKLIFWTKNHRLVPLVGRVRVSSNGALRISRANPVMDAGIFTCSVGMLHAYVNITFQSKKDAREKKEEILNLIFNDTPQKDDMYKSNFSNFINPNTSKTDVFSSFSMTNWSECSKRCGRGLQTRHVTCNQITDNYIRLLPEAECEKKGLQRPTSSQKCVVQLECPMWVTSEWSECSSQQCSKKGFAWQTRRVACEYRNGTRTSEDRCDGQDQPPDKKSCPNPECVPLWHTSDWSECLPRCGKRGQKIRSFFCAWSTSKIPAGNNNCQGLSRPPVSKQCQPNHCPHPDDCTDLSTYCNLAEQLSLCRYAKFRQKCCSTCRRANLSSLA